MNRRRPAFVLGLLAIASIAALGFALCVGAIRAPLGRSLSTVLDAFAGKRDPLSTIVLRVRLPRALVAYVVGASLSMGGGALQGVFQNPLAEPGVLGVSSAAALGAVLAIHAGIAAKMPASLPICASVAAALATLGLLLVGARRGRFAVGRLLLAGLAIANLMAAATTLVISISLANYDIGRQVLRWLLGGLEGRTFAHAWLGLVALVIAGAVLFAEARALDAMLLGDVAALAVGVDPARSRLRIVLATSVLAGVSVAIGGAIGFVGLVVPHVMRRFVGGSHRALLGACLLGGGAFLVVADVVARTAISPEEIRLGVVTAAVGAPLFLWMLVTTRAKESS